jgi:hypothetical protein
VNWTYLQKGTLGFCPVIWTIFGALYLSIHEDSVLDEYIKMVELS